MHGKLALMLAVLATVMGSLSQAPAALAASRPAASRPSAGPARAVAARAVAARAVAARAVAARAVAARAVAARAVAARAVAARSGALSAQSAAPAAPSGLAATVAGSWISLTWTNNATLPAATAIQIERATDPGFTQNVTSYAAGPNAASYTNKSTVAGTTYYFRVLAQNGASDSPWSNALSVLRTGTSAPVSFFGPQFACAAYCAGNFGWNTNASVMTADSVPAGASFSNMLRVAYPKGSISSESVTKLGTRLGGAQAALPFATGATAAPTTLQYYVRPQPGFQSIRGGKLPGLYGGDTTVASGGHDPDGTNGWSARLMWRNDNNGEVYAYLAGINGYGLQLGCGNWTWQPGQWTKVQETVSLNTPGQANGYITVYINGTPALDALGLTFRTVSSLQINGLFFSTFFGGHDKTWATPVAQHLDFAGFSVSRRVASALPAVACKVSSAFPHGRENPAP